MAEIKSRVKKLGPATRDIYGKTLIDLGKKYGDLVVLDGDLSKSTKTAEFSRVFPERFFNCGIQEANMVGIAAGLAYCGKIPFISSFACFLTCKGYDQIRVGIAFPNANVKIVTSHGGISVGEDGVSQQSIEDFALMLTFPNFVVTVPSDGASVVPLLEQITALKGPAYMRCGRPKTPQIYENNPPLHLGRGHVLREGKDVALVACGLLVWEALVAADELAQIGIQATVVDMHTLKPLDEKLLAQLASKTGAVVTCEEHSTYGGLGSIVSQSLARQKPVPVEMVALNDTYAESGTGDELLSRYKLTSADIAKAAQRAVSRKL